MAFEGSQELSNVLGWISIACWLVVYSPQIIENYQLQSGEGLSVGFVTIWLIGDICNLSGAVTADLLPTIIILGVYYTMCDTILLVQIYYYRWKRARRGVPLLIAEHSRFSALYDEASPLLAGDHPEDPVPSSEGWRETFKVVAALLFVFGVGVAAWVVDTVIRGDAPRSKPSEVVEWQSQALGWISAALFLGARIPQIVKNLSTRCEGLSPFLFVYSISGNTTYCLSILAASLTPRHLAVNAPWIAGTYVTEYGSETRLIKGTLLGNVLLGSALTIFLDLFVLYQFSVYRHEDKELRERSE